MKTSLPYGLSPRRFCLLFVVLLWDQDSLILHPHPCYNKTIIVASASSTASSTAAKGPHAQPTASSSISPVASSSEEDLDDVVESFDGKPNLETPTEKPTLVLGVDGGTESIRVSCFDARTGKLVGQSAAVSYPTSHPRPGWAEQNPEDWYQGLCKAVREVIKSVRHELGDDGYEMAAMCLDTTCCSVVALDHTYEPLRPCLLWMDQRSAAQTQQMATLGKGDPALVVNGNKNSPSISAEWLIPKSLWLHQNEKEETWLKAKVICEYQDYLNYRLTGVMTASACNAATRWNWSVKHACASSDHDEPHPGRPMSLYRALGIPELAEKLPQSCLSMGEIVGSLTKQASQDMGLPMETKVIQGGPDAFVGMIGLGCVGGGGVFEESNNCDEANQGDTDLSDTNAQTIIQEKKEPRLCLITGSSHLHCLIVPAEFGQPQENSKGGMWGPYQNAPLPGLAFAEGGQSSTGSLLKWAKNKLFDDSVSYSEMDLLASRIKPGSDGLVALTTFQGSRTPVTDPLARGALVGLTLSHTRHHLWRALMEGVCFGTRACVEALEKATGVSCCEIVLAGGIAQSPLWLQMHADVTNKPIRVFGPNHNACIMGSAILASVGIGVFNTVEEAAHAMLPPSRLVLPEATAASLYTNLYRQVYSLMASRIRPIVHSIHDVQHQSIHPENVENEDVLPIDEETEPEGLPELSRVIEEDLIGMGARLSQPLSAGPDAVTVSPSLLACDFGSIQQEVERCLKAGATRFHVDIFDGVALNAPDAFTFGPGMVRAIAKAIHKCAGDHDTNMKYAPNVIDLHMCVHRPERFVEFMAEAGANTFIFQWEGLSKLGRLNKAIFLARTILQHRMQCGISINPRTPVEEIYPLLETGLVSVVDVLAVEPGFGGQTFQHHVLKKASTLRRWKGEKSLIFDIMVDGGVNKETAKVAKASGANILVSGSFLFGHPQGIRAGMEALMN